MMCVILFFFNLKAEYFEYFYFLILIIRDQSTLFFMSGRFREIIGEGILVKFAASNVINVFIMINNYPNQWYMRL